MQNIKKKDVKNIFFVGRLEYEKGIDIVLNIIKQTEQRNLPYRYHIFGDWSYFSDFSEIDTNLVHCYWRVSPEMVFKKFHEINANAILMPSRFLETFGLVWLEALMYGIPVIGFKKWWLENFITDDLALDQNDPVESFFEIIKKDTYPLPNILKFSYDSWLNNLRELVGDFEKILIIHDYKESIGGAEVYVHNLIASLKKIEKKVEIFAYSWNISLFKRKILFLRSLFAWWNQKQLEEKIKNFQPDLLWSHTVLRQIWLFGVKAISCSNLPHFMTHHDLWLFCVSPSKIYDISDVPQGLRLGKWIFTSKNIFDSCKIVIKWLIVSRIWRYIPKNTTHLIPSLWMKKILENYWCENIKIFPHTIFDQRKKQD